MVDVMIKLRRNGQRKGSLVSVASWEELEDMARLRLETLRNYDGPLEFRDETHNVINEFRTPIANYSRENVWVCTHGESWIEPPPPYRCAYCGDTLPSHKCRRRRDVSRSPMLPIEALVMSIENLFSSKKL